VALGLLHSLWMCFGGGRVAPFPALPRPRLFRVRQLLPLLLRQAAQLAMAALGVAAAALLLRGRADALLRLGLRGALALAVSAHLVAASMQLGRLLLVRPPCPPRARAC
jgi:hypothetical protein